METGVSPKCVSSSRMTIGTPPGSIAVTSWLRTVS
jgi:hypothetical protein